MNLKPFDVGLSAFQGDFLPVSLQFEYAKSRSIRRIVERVRFHQALDVFTGDLGPGLVFQTVDFTQNGCFLNVQEGLAQIGLCLNDVAAPLLGVCAILRSLLLHLVAKVFVFGLRVKGRFQLLCRIELRNDFARLDHRSICNQSR